MREIRSESDWANEAEQGMPSMGAPAWQVAQPPAASIGEEMPHCGAMTLREVLQHTRRQASHLSVALDPQQLGQHNAHTLEVVQACLGVDTSRRRLTNTLMAQTTLDDVAHVLEARVAAGRSDAQALSGLARHQSAVRHSVADAMERWDAASQHFTRLTRLLPSQLDATAIRFVPLDTREIERLAQASVLARLQAREQSAGQRGATAVGEFSTARVAYRQTAAACERARIRLNGVLATRAMAEAGFRFGAHCAVGYAEIVTQVYDERCVVLDRELSACMARYALYALALQLPEQFGLY